MPTILDGKVVDFFEIIPADEGSLDQYYGHIGSGKTYVATAEILRDLRRGKVVYASWRVKWEGYDERSSWFFRLLGRLGLKRNFYYFPAENFHYFPLDSADFMERFEKLTDCVVYLDEGHLVYDSYEKTKIDMKRRAAILHTRHFDRKVVIISQRPTALWVGIRGNVNRFFKMEKCFSFTGYMFRGFSKTEYQDLDSSERPDETSEPASETVVPMRLSVLQAYSSKYMRGDVARSQRNFGILTSYSLREVLSGLPRRDFLKKKVENKTAKINGSTTD